MNTEQTRYLGDLTALLNAFVAGSLGAEEFQTKFLRRFKEDAAPLPDEAFQAVDRFFGDLDAACFDPDLKDPGDLGVDELKASARRTLEELHRTRSSRSP